MKTKIGLSVLFLILIAGGVSLTKSSPEQLVEATKEVIKKIPLEGKSSPDLGKAPSKSETKTREVNDEELITLEKELIEKSNEEIKEAIEKNNKWAEKENFIARANANQLDEATAKNFVMYIRLNNVLHKILIDREIEEMERN